MMTHPPIRARGCSTPASPARRGAFTLLELLVAIAVITVLVAMLLPTVNNARDAARTVLCATNQRSLGIGMITYSSDYQGQLPQYYGQNTGEISLTREWFRFWKGYMLEKSTTIAADLATERKQLWKLGELIGQFDCPTTNEKTNYGYFGTHPKTFDYRLSAQWKVYSTSQPATGIGDPITAYTELPADGIWLIDSASKIRNEDFSNSAFNSVQPMSGQEHPTFDIYPGGSTGQVITSWFYTNTSTAPGNDGWCWTSPQLGNYSGNNYFTPGIHHKKGANILTADGAVNWHPIDDYLPELNEPINWRSTAKLVPQRRVR